MRPLFLRYVCRKAQVTETNSDGVRKMSPGVHQEALPVAHSQCLPLFLVAAVMPQSWHLPVSFGGFCSLQGAV